MKEIEKIRACSLNAATLPADTQESLASVAELNRIYEGKDVFFEVNKMGLCVRLGKSLENGIESMPYTLDPIQCASYVEHELPDGSGFKILKDRYCSTGQVLYKSSLG